MNGKERVLDFLKSNVGKKMPTFDIADSTKHADNTTVKWLCALRNEGNPIEREKWPGKSYYHGWYGKPNSIYDG